VEDTLHLVVGIQGTADRVDIGIVEHEPNGCLPDFIRVLKVMLLDELFRLIELVLEPLYGFDRDSRL